MLRTVFTKIMWVGRATTFAIGLAVILALTVGVATTATAAKAPTLKLGVQNAVRAATSMAGTLADPILRLDNNGAGPALDLQVEPGRAPMTVNSDGKVTNLNADRIDGQEASAFLPADGKANDAAHADRADSAGSADSATSATNAQNATSAQNAANADTLDGQDSTAFLPAGGKANDADRLDGKDSGVFAIRTDHNFQPVHDCDTPGRWNECAPVTVTVPAGKTYYVSVWSSFSARGGTDIQQVSYCSGGKGPSLDPNNSCITPFARANSVTLEGGNLKSIAVSSSGETVPLSEGAYTFFTRIAPARLEFASDFQSIAITKVMVRDTANSF